jgi:SAM-dependent MidA family methyltransferase
MWCTGVPVRGEVILNTDEREHSDRMRRVLALELSSLGGWMSFEHYMDLVLYSPGLGYYSSGTRKFGSGGDFTTAPEVSRLFGACVAQQCTEILNEVSHGRILEIGAGTGKLAVDVLMRLEALKCLPERYLILEISGDLRDRQRALIARHIPHLQHRVTWLDVLPDAPWDGVIIANEVLDALPVVRFRWGADECQELGVACEHDEFAANLGRMGGRVCLRVLRPAPTLDGSGHRVTTDGRGIVVRLRVTTRAVLPGGAA